MGGANESLVASAMDKLWAKFLPQMEERVSTLQQAAENFASGSLSEENQRRASAEAHKLAGVLGTFGLQHGTELAREAEEVYGSTPNRSPAIAERLTEIAEQLKAMIAGRR